MRGETIKTHTCHSKRKFSYLCISENIAVKNEAIVKGLGSFEDFVINSQWGSSATYYFGIKAKKRRQILARSCDQFRRVRFFNPVQSYFLNERAENGEGGMPWTHPGHSLKLDIKQE
jgi:hypothetical protein